MTIGEQLDFRPATRKQADWRNQASCRFLNPVLFFPAGTSGGALEEIQAAQAACETCPVREACLQYALETNQEAGIWGGVTEDDRSKLRRSWLADRRRRAG